MLAAASSLEHYRESLDDETEDTIKEAISRLSQVFRSDLFSALIGKLLHY